ncbi:hypothetical protein [uncultured Pseudomonas sp.]|uniref:hypothetical protein n=1 Tax=uncultured Pseudomonas sp. TaxID=114707 RepID=UPI00258EF0D8|nr:hypothetical protein [uncultured Pseudomonas sp.]
MNIQQAISKSRLYIWGGRTLVVISSAFYFIALLLLLYKVGQEMSRMTFMYQAGFMLQNFVSRIYEVTSPFIEYVWRYAPDLNRHEIFSYGNLWFLGLLGLMLTGKQLVATGLILRRRVQKQLDRMEEWQWRRSMEGGAAASTTINSKSIGQVNVYQQPMPEGPDKSWWKEPLGSIGISIFTGYLVSVLAKITGMV